MKDTKEIISDVITYLISNSQEFLGSGKQPYKDELFVVRRPKCDVKLINDSRSNLELVYDIHRGATFDVIANSFENATDPWFLEEFRYPILSAEMCSPEILPIGSKDYEWLEFVKPGLFLMHPIKQGIEIGVYVTPTQVRPRDYLDPIRSSEGFIQFAEECEIPTLLKVPSDKLEDITNNIFGISQIDR